MNNLLQAFFPAPQQKRQLALIALFGVFTLSIEADIIYKSVDDQGNIRYSDQPPEDNQLLIENIELPEYSNSDTSLHNSNLEQISQTADRLKQDRLNREELKLKQQQLRQASSPPEYHPTIIEENNYYSYPRRFYPRRNFWDFPSIHDRKIDFHHRKLSDELKDSGPVITPKKPLLTP